MPAEMCALPWPFPCFFLASSLHNKDTDTQAPYWTWRCLGSELRMPNEKTVSWDVMPPLNHHAMLHCQHPDFLDVREISFPLVEPLLQGSCCCHVLSSLNVTNVPLSLHRPPLNLQNARFFLLVLNTSVQVPIFLLHLRPFFLRTLP